MYTFIIIFYVSLLAIVAMIVLKRREIVALKNNPISKISARADSFLDKNYSAIRKFISYLNKHTFIAITQWIVYHILLHIRKGYVEIKHQALQNPHTRNMIYAVRGKGEVKKHGASFYLRRIGENRSRN